MGTVRGRSKLSSFALLQLLWVPVSNAHNVTQLLAQASTALSNSDLSPGGSCDGEAGCVREVVTGQAVILGRPRETESECAVLEGNSFDGFHVGSIDGATLGVVHSCEDGAGEMLGEVCTIWGWIKFVLIKAACLSIKVRMKDDSRHTG